MSSLRICGWSKIQLSDGIHSKPTLLWHCSHWGEPKVDTNSCWTSLTIRCVLQDFSFHILYKNCKRDFKKPDLVQKLLLTGPCPFPGAKFEAFKRLVHVPQWQRPPHPPINLSWGKSMQVSYSFNFMARSGFEFQFLSNFPLSLSIYPNDIIHDWAAQ